MSDAASDRLMDEVRLRVDELIRAMAERARHEPTWTKARLLATRSKIESKADTSTVAMEPSVIATYDALFGFGTQARASLKRGEPDKLRTTQLNPITDRILRNIRTTFQHLGICDDFPPIGKEPSKAWVAFLEHAQRELAKRARSHPPTYSHSPSLADLPAHDVGGRAEEQNSYRPLESPTASANDPVEEITSGGSSHPVPTALRRLNSSAAVPTLGSELPDTERTADTSQRVPAVFRVPIHVPLQFIRQDDLFSALDTVFTTHATRPPSAALYGMHGVGKTVLAAAYAIEKKASYRVVWWINARTKDSARHSLQKLGARLGWIPEIDNSLAAAESVLDGLSGDGTGFLLIYDNAESVAMLLPFLPTAGGAKILITSNATDWRSIAEPIGLPLWSKEQGAKYLVDRTNRLRDGLAAVALSDALGGLPLAHAQAAAYCAGTGTDFERYLALFAAHPVKFLDDADHADAQYSATNGEDQLARVTVAKTFRIAIGQIAHRLPAARQLLAYAAILPPEPLAYFLFLRGADFFPSPLRSSLQNGEIESLVELLVAFSLVERVVVNDKIDGRIFSNCIVLHKILREIIIAYEFKANSYLKAVSPLLARLFLSYQRKFQWLSRNKFIDQDGLIVPEFGRFSRAILNLIEPRQAALVRWIHIATRCLPRDARNEPEQWPLGRRIHNLGMFLAEHMGHPLTQNPQSGFFLFLFASYMDTNSNKTSLIGQLLLQSRVILEVSLGKKHILTSAVYVNLSNYYADIGDDVEAERLTEIALKIRERSLGPLHPWCAICLFNLSVTKRKQDRIREAIALLERVAEIRMMNFGRYSEQVAVTFDELGKCYEILGEQNQAYGYLIQSAHIRLAVFGERHFAYGRNLAALASFHETEKKYDLAAECLDLRLNILSEYLPRDHESIIACRVNIVRNLVLRDQYDSAVAKCNELVGEFTETFGNDRTGARAAIASHARGLAEWLFDQERYAEAEVLYLASLEMRKKALGEFQPEVASDLNALGYLYQSQGEFDRAKDFFEQALMRWQASYGPKHPDVGRALNNLGFVAFHLGDLDGAKAYYQRALEILDQAGEEQRELLETCRANFDHLQSSQGEFTE